MLPRKLTIKGIGPYQNETVDFSQVKGDLIAVAGLNGSGKTFLLECLVFGLYRTLPSRPAGIYKYCTERNARLEFDFLLNGTEYQSTIVIDSKMRKMEAVLAINKRPITDGKTGTFDAEITRILGPIGQVLASSYGAQTKAGNFIELQKADRKDLFIRMIGLTQLQQISDLAKQHAAQIDKEKQFLEGQVLQVREVANRSLPDTTAVEADIATARQWVADFEASATAKRDRLATLKSQTANVPILEAEQTELSDGIKRNILAVSKLGADAIQEQAYAAALEQYSQRVESLGQMIPIAQERLATLKQKCSNGPALRTKATELETRMKQLRDAIVQMEAEGTRSRSLVDRIDMIRAAAASLVTQQDRRDELTQQQAQTRSELTLLVEAEQRYREAEMGFKSHLAECQSAEKAAQSLLDRAHRDAEFVKTVPCRGEGKFAECQFLVSVSTGLHADDYQAQVDDARAAALAVRSEAELTPKPDVRMRQTLQVRAAEVEKELTSLIQAIRTGQIAAADLPAAEAANAKLQAIRVRMEEAKQTLGMAELDYDGIKTQMDDIKLHTVEIAQIGIDINSSVEELKQTIVLQQRSNQAVIQLESIANQKAINEEMIAQLRTRQTAVEAQLSSIQALMQEQSELAQWERNANTVVASMRQQLEESIQQKITLEAERDTILKAQGRLIVLETELNPKLNQMACYNRIARSFGPMEIQSFEIDCAGPEVSRIANELLFDCFGPRYSIRLVTQEAKTDGSGYKDEFDVSVCDQKYDRWVSIDDLSGGQKVIVTEALALAIALFNKERNGIAWDTLFRDETASALDDQYAPQYIQMLRAAREKGHFAKVVFISHQGKMKDLADSRIMVQDGKISIET